MLVADTRLISPSKLPKTEYGIARRLDHASETNHTAMTPQRRHQAQWEQLFEEKRLEFLNNDCRRALQIESFDELQTGLQELASSYQTNGFPDLLSRLNPTLQHIQSFNSAITSASQANPKACLVWGATQALMQVIMTLTRS